MRSNQFEGCLQQSAKLGRLHRQASGDAAGLKGFRSNILQLDTERSTRDR